MSISTRGTRGVAAIVALSCAALIGLSACTTGAPQSDVSTANVAATSSAPASTSSAASNAATSSAPAPAPSSTSSAPPPPPTDQPTVMYISGATSVKPGQAAKYSLTVETPNEGVPHGTVTLLVDGSVAGTAELNAQGKASFTQNSLSAGDHVISGTFAANTDYVAAKSKSLKTHMMTQAEVDALTKPATGATLPANNKCPAAAAACVDLTDSVTWLQSGGAVTVGPVKMIGGKAGDRTPTGTFHVLYKEKLHLSKEFDNAPMPYSVFFTNTGVAFHQDSLTRASAGCVHLSLSNAITFFNTLNPGDMVFVYGTPSY